MLRACLMHMSLGAILTALTTIAVSSYASAQTATAGGAPNSTGLAPSVRVATPLGQTSFAQSSVPPLPHPEALWPDPFGWNTWLRSHGIAILLDNVDEFSGALTSPTKGLGLRQGSANAGQYGLETDIDWERLAGIKGFSTHTVMVGRYGIPASRMFGDNLNPSQEIYGAGGNVAIHFVYGYGEETLWNGRFDAAAGRIPLLTDFSANPLYCNFMNNAFCGNPKAASDNTSHSSYPDSGWAARFRVRPTTDTYIQSGVYFHEKGIYGVQQMRTGFKLNGADIDGEAAPVEVGWEPLFGHDKLPGHYKLGGAVDTADHPDQYYDINGNPYILTGQKQKIHHNSWSAWALADQMLFRHHGNGPDAGLIAIATFYNNSPVTQTRERQYNLGVLDRGFWHARPLDAWGVNFSYVQVAERVTRSQELQQSLGYTSLLNGSYFPQTNGMIVEAMYQIHVFRGVTFMPDFQYFIRPGAQQGLKDAAMLGFKSHIELF
ncbi:carbohydrate-selective porin B [Neoasaia chiangmaiensis NBRC 101099]|uniref:carbohydrate porin n=1 Tax=Neoasaia chiangmaiensis TaxID=320497 RepID=UPI000989FB5B|nr:carbohydrate porin [Neoasaia chiangmaiensis]GBR42523.1 carbohydrate-selective porin B [Neoasaia chiangmaiensis NBRC 101099]GEN16282.1 porin [Neoasaia chiangmaiensis]